MIASILMNHTAIFLIGGMGLTESHKNIKGFASGTEPRYCKPTFTELSYLR